LVGLAPRFSGTIGSAPCGGNEEDAAKVLGTVNSFNKLTMTALARPAALSREMMAKMVY
jgi:hypothetical protein